MKRHLQIILSLLVIGATTPFNISAQVAMGNGYALEQSVIAGGGGTSSGSSGTNTFSVDGTIGQSVAGNAGGGSTFQLTSGFWSFAAAAAEALGFEADIANRPSGDSLFASDDLIQLRRFLNGADTPDSTTANEFQRADSAPFATKGDGALCSSDLIQLRRYLNGADAPQTAGGVSSPIGSCGNSSNTAAAQSSMTEREGNGDGKNSTSRAQVSTDKAGAPAAARELRVESPSPTSAAQTVMVNIRVDALGDEAAYSFRLNYNQAVLTNPVINSGTTGAAIVDCDASVTDRIGCTIEAFPVNQTGSSSASIREIGAGDNQLLLSITFTVASNATAQTVALTLSNVSTSNDRAQNLTITATNGNVTIAGATAAPVSIGGRVLTASGRGIKNVSVTLIDANGAERTTLTTSFGYYRFDDVTAGETVTISVKSRRFKFNQSSIVKTTNDSITDADFVGVD